MCASARKQEACTLSRALENGFEWKNPSLKQTAFFLNTIPDQRMLQIKGKPDDLNSQQALRYNWFLSVCIHSAIVDVLVGKMVIGGLGYLI